MLCMLFFLSLQRCTLFAAAVYGIRSLKTVKDSDILLYAAQLGYRTIIQLLRKWGMDVNRQSIFTGTTPLLTAVSPNNLDEVKKAKTVAVLLKCGAKESVNLKNRNGDSPLIMAVLTGQAAVFDLLVKEGATLGERDKYGNTILHIAAQVNANVICEKIMDRADFSDEIFADKNDDGQTPIHLAAMHSPQCLKEITSTLKCRHGKSRYPKFVEWFSTRDSNDCTPLDVAAKSGQKATFEWMWGETEKYVPAHIEAERSKLKFLIDKAADDPSRWQGVIDFLKLFPKRM